jgi:hypothetical protein
MGFGLVLSQSTEDIVTKMTVLCYLIVCRSALPFIETREEIPSWLIT